MRHERYDQLIEVLRSMGSAALAFSGGVDSALLLRAIADAGIRSVAITAVSPLMPEHEVAQARMLAASIGATHLCLETEELSDERFRANPPDRCYYCKAHRLARIAAYARSEGYSAIIDGSNADDRHDYRPGMRACAEFGVRSPLMELDMDKCTIREIARELGLPVWNKPSSPCLATRIPYGTMIAPEELQRIAAAEAAVAAYGFRELRVRSDGATARIEVPPDQIPLLLDAAVRERIVAALREFGYRFVSVDLCGYRSGSMNPEERDKQGEASEKWEVRSGK